MDALADLISQNKLQGVIAARFPLERVPDAFNASMAGRVAAAGGARELYGKLAILIAKST